MEGDHRGFVMRYLGSHRFRGADGSMGLRNGKVYDIEADGNRLNIYDNNGYERLVATVPYTVEGFFANWSKAAFVFSENLL